MLSLAPFLTPQISPLAGGDALQRSVNSVAAMMQNKAQLEEQNRASVAGEEENNRSNLAREQQNQQELALRAQGQQFGQAKDQTSALGRYIDLLKSGKTAEADSYAQTLSGMGITVEQAGQMPHDAVEQMSYQQGPTPQAPTAPQDDRVDFSASNVNSVRAPQDDQAREMAEAKARVAELGGDTSGFELPQPPPAEQPIPQAQPQLAPQAPSRLAPLGQMNYSINGQQRGSIDPQALQAEQRGIASREGGAITGMVPQRFQGLLGGLQDAPNEEALAGRLGPAMKVYGEESAGERARAMAQSKQLSMGATFDEHAASAARTIIREATTQSKAIRLKAQTLTESLGAIASANSVEERFAQLELAKQSLKGALSDMDMDYIQSAAGKWDQLLTKVGSWTNAGRLSEGLRKELEGAMRDMKTMTQRHLSDIAENQVARIVADPQLVRALGQDTANQFGKILYSSVTGSTPPPPYRRGPGPRPVPKVTITETSSSKGGPQPKDEHELRAGPDPHAPGPGTRPVPGTGKLPPGLQ